MSLLKLCHSFFSPFQSGYAWLARREDGWMDGWMDMDMDTWRIEHGVFVVLML